MARKKPVDEGKAKPVVKPLVKPLVGRARINSAPIKEWSGGLSEHEVAMWEAIADEIRTGTPPSVACGAVGKSGAWATIRRSKNPLYRYLISAWDEGTQVCLSKIKKAEAWQALAWLLERTRPEMFALDNALRQTIQGWAQEAGLEVADLADLIRIVKEAKELEVSLWDVLEEAKQRARAVQGS